MNTARKYLPHAARILAGLIFTVFGLNGFLHFLPQPAPPPAAGAFLGALFHGGYLFPLLKGTEVAMGLLLLSGRFVPLALTVLAPIVVNIVAFHAFFDPHGLPVGLVLVAAELYLAWVNRAAFAPMLRARAASSTAQTQELPRRLASAA